MTRRRTTALSAAAAAAFLSVVAAAPRDARAALSATVQLTARAATVVVGQPLAVDVYLRNLLDTTTPASPAKVGGVELDFGGVSNASTPRRFVAAAGAPNGFVPGATFAATLPLTFAPGDASLLDGHAANFADLSYFVANNDKTGGLPSNGGPGGDVLVGTLYVTATAPGVGYALNADGPATSVTANDANQTAFGLSYLPATFSAVAAPEPATLAAAAAAAALGAIATRRRRR